MSDLMLDVGQANELKLAFRRANFNNDDIKRLCEGGVLADVRNVLLGHAEIVTPEHVIDCDADPYVPDGWSVLPDEEQLPNRIRGSFKWNAAGVALHLDKGQKKGDKGIEGNKLRKVLARKPVLNANVLDYLFTHFYLIPEEWKGKAVFFWGTIYRDPDGFLYVRGLYWGGSRWYSNTYWLGFDCFDCHLAAVSAS